LLGNGERQLQVISHNQAAAAAAVQSQSKSKVMKMAM